MTAKQMVSGVKELTRDWTCDAVAIGYPGPVIGRRPAVEPDHLGRGWVGFNFKAACGRPVKTINDPAMQALGSYKSGTPLFVGLGTGLGSALVVQGNVVPMELGHLSYKKGAYEDCGHPRIRAGLGKKKWSRRVGFGVVRLVVMPSTLTMWFLGATTPMHSLEDSASGMKPPVRDARLTQRLGHDDHRIMKGARTWLQE